MHQRRAGQALKSANVLLEPGGIDNLRLTWRLVRDARVAPAYKLLVPLAVLLYLLSPIDLIPDFLLGIGQIDDLGLIGMALLITFRLLPRLSPADVVDQHRIDLGLQPRPQATTNDTDRTTDRTFDVVDAAYRVYETPPGTP